MPGVRVTAIYGGAPYVPQKRALEAGTQIIVGTPGRVIDHMERGTLDLSEVHFVVLDEGDEMMRMGFAEEVEKILTNVPVERQTALFSATMPPAIRKTVQAHLRDPRKISVTPESSTVASVEQRYAIVPNKSKVAALARVLATSGHDAALIFVHTRDSADTVGAALVERGIAASVISGKVSQSERGKTVERLRSGQLNVLVATDVAARGLDVERVGLVVNFDMPREVESYVHRIGRTGRAGRAGVAFSFITPKERDRLRRVEKTIGVELTQTAIPSPSEVTTHRIAALLSKVEDRQASGQLTTIRRAVEAYLNDPSNTEASEVSLGGADDLQRAINLATTLAALAINDHGSANREDEDLDAELAGLTKRERRERVSRESVPAAGKHHAPRHHYDHDAKPSNHPRHEQHRGPRPNRYWVGVGHRDGVRPAAIVSTITSEAGLRGRDLGKIEVFANFSLVEITAPLSRHTLQRLARARVAGRALRIRPDAERARF
jgi:ATP-dependent RNA helicase DeaD